MINLCPKYEVYMFTHYEDMKKTKNAKIGVVWGDNFYVLNFGVTEPNLTKFLQGVHSKKL